MTAITTLVSKLNVDRGLSEISSSNIASADVDGYVRKEAQTYSTSTGGGLSGVKLSSIYNTIDPILLYHTRKENSILSMYQARDQFYQDINLLFGNKGSQGSYAHNLGKFISSVSNVTSDASVTNKSAVINNAIIFAQQISSMADRVTNFRASADEQLGKAIESFNDLISKIAQINQKIASLSYQTGTGPDGGAYVDITSLENERDLYVQQLSGLADINVYKAPNNKLNISLAGSGQILVQGATNYPLGYTASASVVPGQVLSPIDYLGTDITTQIQGGRIAGLVQVRDTVLPNMQEELDELTRVIRDTTNAIHNEGSSFNGSSTLTGTDFAPGLVGAMTGATAISGQGTLRLAVLDKEGTIIDYKDVPLTNGMTVGGLVAAINGANYVISGTPVATPGGDFTITQLASGGLQIQSTSGNTIAIGSESAGGTAKISLGAAYDPTTGLGFSHFFGMNNFFITGNDLASSTAQVGIANQLAVRADFFGNPSYLAVGTLNSDTPIPIGRAGALANTKTDIVNRIATQLRTGDLNFLAAGPLDAVSMNAESYAARVLDTIQAEVNQSKHDVDLYQSSYDKFAKLAADKASVDPAEELVKIYNISSSQAITSKVLSLVLEMTKSVINIL